MRRSKPGGGSSRKEGHSRGGGTCGGVTSVNSNPARALPNTATAVWPTSSDRVYWYRFDEPPVIPGGILDPLAVVTLCDTMPGAVGERMGPGVPFWLPPSTDITIHLFGDAGPDWLLAHNRARWAGDGYASVEMALWDPARGLVAHATQVMVFSFPDGPPSPAQRRPRV